MAYQFHTQYEQGKRAEAFLDRYFSRWFIVAPIPVGREKAEGFDRIFTRRSNYEQLKIEYKADWTAAVSGNAFLETVSVDSEHKAGWVYTSQADVLVYFVPPHGLIHMLSLTSLRALLPSWRLRFREVTAPNDGYNTRGLLVPLAQFGKYAVKRTVEPQA